MRHIRLGELKNGNGTMDTKSFPKKKHPAIATVLTLILGPLGYLYIGWRYAVSCFVIFAVFIILFSAALFVPTWLKYVNVLVLAFWSVQVCQIRNTIISEKHSDAFAFNTFPVAVFAMTTLLPILATVDTIAIGIYMSVQRMIGGEIGKGLIILLLATPFLSVVHYFVSSLIAAGIDKLVLWFAPNAPTNIFPSAIGCSKNK